MGYLVCCSLSRCATRMVKTNYPPASILETRKSSEMVHIYFHLKFSDNPNCFKKGGAGGNIWTHFRKCGDGVDVFKVYFITVQLSSYDQQGYKHIRKNEEHQFVYYFLFYSMKVIFISQLN